MPATDALTDRAPRSCNHKQANHQHGTYSAYKLDGCRCHPCKDAVAAYNRRRDRQIAYGRWKPYTDAAPVRAHVQRLQASGLGWKRVARLAGLDTSILWKLLYGDPSRGMAPSKRVRPSTADAILAVKADPTSVADGVLADATGTHRRLQALVALGWSQAELARRLEISPGNFFTLMRAVNVRMATARAVQDLYDELWDQRPATDTHRSRISVSRALRYARLRGWAPPLAWDDSTIDDPHALPDLGDPGRRDLLEDADWLLTGGASWQETAARLGVKPSSLTQAYARAGLTPARWVA